MKKRKQAISRGLALLLALFIALPAVASEMVAPPPDHADLPETTIDLSDIGEPEADSSPGVLLEPSAQTQDAPETGAESDTFGAEPQGEPLPSLSSKPSITALTAASMGAMAPASTGYPQITLSVPGDMAVGVPRSLLLTVQGASGSEKITGTVTFWDNDHQLEGPIPLQNNAAELTWVPETAGTHLIKAVYQLWFEEEGVPINGELSLWASVGIKEIDLNACHFALIGADALYYTGAPHEPEVKVSSPNGTELQEGIDFTVYYIGNIDAGTGYVTIFPGELSQYAGSVTLPFTIHKAKTTVSLDRLVDGTDSAILLATVTRGDGVLVTDGAVTFTFAGGNASIPLKNGSNVAQHNLASDSTWAAAAYEGDANHQPSDVAVWEIGSDQYAIALYAERYADGRVALTASVSTDMRARAPAEDISFYDNGVLLATAQPSEGTATYLWPSAANGSHLVTAVYGSGVGSATASIIVNHFPFDATFRAEMQSEYGALLAVAFSGMAGVPGGIVTFFDGEAQLGAVPVLSGSASLSVSGLSPGTHVFHMVYSGDDLHFPAVRTDQISIAYDTAIHFTVNAHADGSADLVASLSATQRSFPTGNITFSGFDALLGATAPLDASGKAVYRWDTIPYGTYSLQAHYSGDGRFNACESPIVTVNNLPAAVSFSATHTAVGGLQFSLSISPENATAPMPTGIVQFLEDGVVVDNVALTNGQASRSAAPPEKRMVASAIYSGDINYFPVQSEPIVVGENPASLNPSGKARPNITIVATAGSGDGPATLTATVSGTGQWPTGQVIFSKGKEYLGTAELFRGEAVFSWADVKAGSHTIYAEYRGDDMYLGGTAVTVLRKSATANGQAITPEMLRQNPQLILLRDREGKVITRYDTSLLPMRTGVLRLEKDKTREQDFYSYGFNLGHLRELARIQSDGHFSITTPWFTAQMPFSLTSQMRDLTNYIVDRDLRSSELELRLEISKVTKKEDPLMKAYLEMEKPDAEFTLYQVELKLYTLENKKLDFYAKAFPVPVMVTLPGEMESAKTARYNLLDNAFIAVDTSFDEKGALILIVEECGSYVIVKKT